MVNLQFHTKTTVMRIDPPQCMAQAIDSSLPSSFVMQSGRGSCSAKSHL